MLCCPGPTGTSSTFADRKARRLEAQSGRVHRFCVHSHYYPFSRLIHNPSQHPWKKRAVGRAILDLASSSSSRSRKSQPSAIARPGRSSLVLPSNPLLVPSACARRPSPSSVPSPARFQPCRTVVIALHSLLYFRTYHELGKRCGAGHEHQTATAFVECSRGSLGKLGIAAVASFAGPFSNQATLFCVVSARREAGHSRLFETRHKFSTRLTESTFSSRDSQ